MAKLGAPSTNKFNIGTAEVRIGPLASANALTQAHSIGLVDNATVEITQNSVDLLGGFPQVLVDTAVISQEASMTATMREFSQRNFNVLIGEGVGDYVSDNASLTTAVDLTAADTSLVTAADMTAHATNPLIAGDIITIFQVGQPELVTIAIVSAVTTTAVTLDANTPILEDMSGTGGDTISVFKSNQSAIGAITQTNYFACQLVQSERSTGRPVTWNFWKGAVSAGLSYATDATDFASTELQVKMLQPAASEYGTGGSLEHLADIIPTNPTGLFSGGGDTFG